MRTRDPECWIKPRGAREELRSYFDHVDRDVASYYDRFPRIREEQLDSRLVATLEKEPFEPFRHRIAAERSRRGLTPIDLDVALIHTTASESHYGADLGLIAQLNVEDAPVHEKASLLQSKRLHPRNGAFDESCEYPELFSVHESRMPQWERLLEVTEASAYLLYGPERVRIYRSVKPLGNRVISAEQVGIMWRSGKRHFTAADAFEYAIPLREWFVDQFLCCNVGDTKPWTIEIARGGSPDFPVRRAVRLRLEARSEEYNRFI